MVATGAFRFACPFLVAGCWLPACCLLSSRFPRRGGERRPNSLYKRQGKGALRTSRCLIKTLPFARICQFLGTRRPPPEIGIGTGTYHNTRHKARACRFPLSTGHSNWLLGPVGCWPSFGIGGSCSVVGGIGWKTQPEPPKLSGCGGSLSGRPASSGLCIAA